MTRVIVVSGTIAAGKSSTASALRHQLSEAGNSCADIDLDALCQLSNATRSPWITGAEAFPRSIGCRGD